eukprot:TRINITY_DN6884_c0_g2_i3.p1 TRINITY_DN6884_c0_g2~~TRINITY_DN6884_c0_g2_i3.p1  ORF type:complete len:281 (-),score=70.76 TRINITY_DN6884_c0_g2_i3:682-1524(-)
MLARPPRSTLSSSSAASDVYKRQDLERPDLAGACTSLDPAVLVYELEEQANDLLFEQHDTVVTFLCQGKGELVRVPSFEIQLDSSDPQAKARLLSLLQKAVDDSRDQQHSAGQLYSSRGDPMKIDVKARCWEVDRKGTGSWVDLDPCSVTVHSTATVGILEERVMVALDTESIELMRCELALVSGGQTQVLLNGSMPLQQAGFSGQDIQVQAKIFPNTGTSSDSQCVASVADAMIRHSDYYETLFQLVDGGHDELASQAWRILELIPRSESADKALENLD